MPRDCALLDCRRVDCLEDQFEGDLPKSKLGHRQSDYEIHKWFWQRSFVSCWHRSFYENVLMWRAYTSFPHETSLAIRCDLLHLVHSVAREVRFVSISYIDYDKEEFHGERENIWAWFFGKGGIATPYFHKRKEFEGEQELRAILHLAPPKDGPREPFQANGNNVKCKLELLLNGIVLSPSIAGFFNRVKELLAQKGLKSLPIAVSALDGKPNI